MQTLLPKSIGSLEDLNKVFPNEASCIEYLTRVRWHGNIESPFVPHSKVYECQNNRYRCSRSKKYFNVKTNTIFHNSRIPLTKWFAAIFILTNENSSITSVELGKKTSLTQKTAWYMIQRIRAYFDIKKARITRTAVAAKKTSSTEIGTKNMTDWLKSLKQ